MKDSQAMKPRDWIVGGLMLLIGGLAALLARYTLSLSSLLGGVVGARVWMRIRWTEPADRVKEGLAAGGLVGLANSLGVAYLGALSPPTSLTLIVMLACVILAVPLSLLAGLLMGWVSRKQWMTWAVAELNDTTESKLRWITGQMTRIGRPAVQPLLSVYQPTDPRSSPTRFARLCAADILGAIGDQRATNGLTAALEDSEPKVQIAIAEALGKLGDPRAVDSLAALFEDSEPVSLAAVDALAKIGDRRAVGPLLTALRGTRIQVAKAAARALVEIGQPLKASSEPVDETKQKEADNLMGRLGSFPTHRGRGKLSMAGRIKTLRRVLKLSPTHSGAWCGLGNCHAAQYSAHRDVEKAVDCYIKAIEFDPAGGRHRKWAAESLVELLDEIEKKGQARAKRR